MITTESRKANALRMAKLLIQNIKKDWILQRNSFDLPKKVLEESEE